MKREVDYPLKNRYYWHLLYALIFPLYMVCFFAAERLVVDSYWVSYLPLDDRIPFLEPFVLAYCAWYPMLFLMGFYLLWRSSGDFRRYMLYIGVGFLSALAFCVIFPNGQDLRPETFPRENVFTWLLSLLYHADTNTNVLPSMHVIGAFAVIFAAFETPALRKRHVFQAIVIVLSVLVCASTVFVKQHSILDTMAGVPWSFAVWCVVYLPGRKKRLHPELLEKVRT